MNFSSLKAHLRIGDLFTFIKLFCKPDIHHGVLLLHTLKLRVSGISQDLRYEIEVNSDYYRALCSKSFFCGEKNMPYI